jgi:hypothetical protein
MTDPSKKGPFATEQRLITMTREVIFQYMVPVHVKVEDDIVRKVVVLDDAPVTDATFVEGDEHYLDEAVEVSLNGQPWPGWQFGY